MKYETVLLDLDGTVTDSAPGITNSVAYALRKAGVESIDYANLNKFVGPPLMDSFRQFYGYTPEEARQGVVYYREYFTDKGIFENEVYEGIREVLQELQGRGHRLALATSKPEVFARRIMDHFDLTDYFAYIGGSEMNETRTGKAAVIEYVLEELGITDRSSVVMVGDREHDVLGAAKCGLPCIGALYGYGSREELESAGACAIAETPADLLKLL